MTYVPRPGDRFRAEITAKNYSGPDADGDMYLSFEINMTTAELIEPARSPGQRAYEAAAEIDPSAARLPWGKLSDRNRANWERIAEAARSVT